MFMRETTFREGVLVGLFLVVLCAAHTLHSQQQEKATIKLSPVEREKIHSTLHPEFAHLQKLREINPGQELRILVAPRLRVGTRDPNRRKNPACTADAIVIGVVKDRSAYLTQQETFILSDYTVSVEEVLKDNLLAKINPGDSIVVNRPGGTLVLGGRKVKTIDQDYHSLRLAGRYLLYLQFIPETSSYRGLLPDVTLENPDPKALVQTRKDLAGCGPAGDKRKG